MSDEALVRLAQADGGTSASTARDVLFARYLTKVSTWCYRVTRDADRAADAAQEVFLRLQTRLESFRGNSRFSTWLYTFTRHTTINYLTSQNRHTDHSEPAVDSFGRSETSASSPYEHTARAQLEHKLRDALRSELSFEQARVVYLHYFCGMSLPAITEQLELRNRSGAKAALVAAKRQLKGTFARELAELDAMAYRERAR